MSDFSAPTSSNLIVNYLPQSFTDRELFSMFVTIGPIEKCHIMKDYKTGYSYGFGFVSYTRPEDADRAIKMLNGTEIYNKRIKVSFARPPGEDIKDTNLYVTKLPKHYDESKLESLFGAYGRIVQTRVLKDKVSGMPRGVAFVRYNRREEAQEAIRQLDGRIPEGGYERLVVRVAEEHGKQKAAYFAGWQAGVKQTCGKTGCSPGRGGGNNANFNDYLPISYPLRNEARFGPLRQIRPQQRFDPVGFGTPGNRF